MRDMVAPCRYRNPLLCNHVSSTARVFQTKPLILFSLLHLLLVLLDLNLNLIAYALRWQHGVKVNDGANFNGLKKIKIEVDEKWTGAKGQKFQSLIKKVNFNFFNPLSSLHINCFLRKANDFKIRRKLLIFLFFIHCKKFMKLLHLFLLLSTCLFHHSF